MLVRESIQLGKDFKVVPRNLGPLGHTWLGDSFSYKTSDDFVPDDFAQVSFLLIKPVY
jgi:hypothetical protein